jgi:beta-glucosidase-like glycosyl hydrolase
MGKSDGVFWRRQILSGDLGKAMILGDQKKNHQIPQNGVLSCLKHFAAYGGYCELR